MKKEGMPAFSQLVREFAMLEGAVAAGIVTQRCLEEGPPSTDLTYVLAGAKAAVSFAVALEQDRIAPYLRKQDRLVLEREFVRANVVASGIALHLANYLKSKGYESVPVAANLVYRPAEGGSSSYDPTETVYPDLAHRYLAARAGLGHIGMSGNFIMPEHGAA
jgi:epoxyqueuosine reductase QueG